MRLGSLPAGVPAKAAMLDRAVRAGLPVPGGMVVVTRDPAAVRGCTMPGTVAVRSAFGSEDGVERSLAGRFVSVLDVDGGDPDALEAAAGSVLASAPPGTRTAVLVMRMVDARHAGVAFTESNHEDDLVNWTAGLADRLVGGGVPGERLPLPKLRRGERPDAHGPQFARRLQVLMRDVRRVFGHRDWDVEWADDGDRCWLLQIRPVTRRTVRDDVFTIANHKEILPPLPSRFMASMIGASGEGLVDWFRRHDPRVPRGRPLVEVFHGRPMINLSLLVDMTRMWGVPSRLVTDSLGGDLPGEARGVRLGRLARSAPHLLRIGVAQRRAAADSRRTERAILQRTLDPGDTIAACIATLRWEYVTLVNQMAALTSAMSVPVSLLRALGTLAEHSRTQHTAATAMSDDLAELRALAAADPDAAAILAAGQLPAGRDWAAAWERWAARHGHRGVFESDIARPRYAEAPAPILTMAAMPPPGGTPGVRTARGRLTAPLWRLAAGPIAARERLRWVAMLGFARIRARLLELADAAVADGRLPNREALWDLEIREATLLDAGGLLPDDLLERRAREIAEDAATSVPDLMRRFGEVDAAPPAGGAALRGISLTTGRLTGTAWVLAEPAPVPPDGLREPIILVARSVDPGWIPTFAQVAGVVVETGGDLSHGSIILRELGLPAVTNVHGATRAVGTGQRVELRAGEGVVRVLATIPETPARRDRSPHA